MCTVTWTRGNGSYTLLMNRDELHSRSPALPPEVCTDGTFPYIAPIDGDAGGSWIGVNALGLTVCLLNHYPDTGEPLVRTVAGPGFRSVGEDRSATGYPGRAQQDAGQRSRGLLLLSLLAARSCGGVTAALGMADLALYRPFLVFALGTSCGPTLHRWNGNDLVVVREPLPPITTSSFDTQEVLQTRLRSYDQLVGRPTEGPEQPDTDVLAAYHASHVPQRGPYSVCTHREDGGSRSLSLATVDAETVSFQYAPGPPCEIALGAPVLLERVG